MKNLKKLLAVALSLAILLTLTVPVMAAELTAAEKVELPNSPRRRQTVLLTNTSRKQLQESKVPFFCYAYWAKKMKPCICRIRQLHRSCSRKRMVCIRYGMLKQIRPLALLDILTDLSNPEK